MIEDDVTSRRFRVWGRDESRFGPRAVVYLPPSCQLAV